ncbi:MAG TPA: hypothetical protein VG165_10025 [Solirubrobacteraceae bacterium]|nr:hypothetical protein [Solirubrobacteraceae bacterium]
MSDAIGAFKRLPPAGQAAVVAVTAWNVTLSIAAERDIQRRRSDEIRGNKLVWRLLCLTNTVGPAIYFRWGRRPPAQPQR